MRVQVNISDEMVAKIDEYARKMGVSRSALCSVFVGQGIMGYERWLDWDDFEYDEETGVILGIRTT